MGISIEELAKKVIFTVDDLREEFGPTSEERFQGLESPRDAVRKIKQETSRLAEQLTLEWNPVIKKTEFANFVSIDPEIARSAGRLTDDDGSDFLVASFGDKVVGYAKVHNGEMKMIEVSSEFRRSRSEGLCREVDIEGETFSVGIGHALVAECVSRFKKLRANANSESVYIFGSLGGDAVDSWTYVWN